MRKCFFCGVNVPTNCRHYCRPITPKLKVEPVTHKTNDATLIAALRIMATSNQTMAWQTNPREGNGNDESTTGGN